MAYTLFSLVEDSFIKIINPWECYYFMYKLNIKNLKRPILFGFWKYFPMLSILPNTGFLDLLQRIMTIHLLNARGQKNKVFSEEKTQIASVT